MRSIDAALALVARKLAVYSITTTVDPSGNEAAITWWPNGLSSTDDVIGASAASESLAVAIVTCLLRALQSQESEV